MHSELKSEVVVMVLPISEGMTFLNLEQTGIEKSTLCSY